LQWVYIAAPPGPCSIAPAMAAPPRPDAIVGAIACQQNALLFNRRVTLSVKRGRFSGVKPAVSAAREDTGTGKVADAVEALVVTVPRKSGAPTTFTVTGRLGNGSYGNVFKFSAANGRQHLAVKILSDQDEKDVPLGIKAIPTTLECNVVRTMHFLGGLVQVMEMATDSVWNTTMTPAVADKFDVFSNKTAVCLLTNGLVCPDWKLGNVAYFRPGDGCARFRVIDVDGITFPAVNTYEYIATFSCAAMPTVTRASSPEQRTATTFYTLANTAYAIELGKCMFRYMVLKVNAFRFESLGANSPYVNEDTIAATATAFTRAPISNYGGALASVRALLHTMAAIEAQDSNTPELAAARVANLKMALHGHFAPVIVVEAPFADLCVPATVTGPAARTAP
jgi:hypothetical protein